MPSVRYAHEPIGSWHAAVDQPLIYQAWISAVTLACNVPPTSAHPVPMTLYALALDPDDVSLSCSTAAWISAHELDQDFSTSMNTHSIALPIQLMGPTVQLAESPWSLAWLNFLFCSLQFRIPFHSSEHLLWALAIDGHLETLRMVVHHLDRTSVTGKLVRGLDIVSRLLALPADHIKRIQACLTLLILEGIGVDHLDAEDYSPLMRAVMLGNDDVVKLLIQAHADVHHLSKIDRATAWSLAIELGHSYMVPWLAISISISYISYISAIDISSAL